MSRKSEHVLQHQLQIVSTINILIIGYKLIFNLLVDNMWVSSSSKHNLDRPLSYLQLMLVHRSQDIRGGETVEVKQFWHIETLQTGIDFILIHVWCDWRFWIKSKGCRYHHRYGSEKRVNKNYFLTKNIRYYLFGENKVEV